MSVSKEQFLKYGDFTCQLIHHEGGSCLKSIPYTIKNGIIGSAKFFFPIYLARTVYEYKNLKDPNFWKRTLKAYAVSIGYGLTYGMIFIYTMCIFRKFGPYHYYTPLVCATLAGASVFVESEENKVLDCIMFCNQFLENIISYLDKKDIFKRTRLRETLTFMMSCGALMYLLKIRDRKNKLVNFWFFHPTFPKKDATKNEANINPKVHCYHKETCVEYSFKGAYRFFLVGCAVEATRTILSKLHRVHDIPRAVFKKETALFGVFIGGFVGLYRSVSCFLMNRNKAETPSHTLIAGFLAGSLYFAKPSLTLLSISLTTIIQVLLLSKKETIDDLTKRMKIPLKELAFALMSGILIHHYINHSPSCPAYIKNMISATTNKQLEIALKHYMKHMKVTPSQ